MNKRKILWGIGTMAAVLIVLPLFAAFEAHVVNVTAKIENALSVATDAIDFGTVFPQEHLELPLSIALSESFMAEDRVDDVNYIIRQKPKCGVTENDGQDLIGPTWTGHIVTDGNDYTVDCDEDRPESVDQGAGADFYLLPSLCEYLSKEPDTDEDPQNDGTLASFHNPFTVANNVVTWLDTAGRLAKSDGDTVDNWTIDLSVPCFGDHCAQDWADFVDEHDGENQANAADYVQPIENEHKVFGCNLWVEVTEVSEQPPTRYTGRVLAFSSTGWAGHSCEGVDEYAVGGGTIGHTEAIEDQGIAAFGAPDVGGSSYPDYPHYSYNGGVNASGGEEGYVVQNGAVGQSMAVYVDCLPR